MKKFIGIVLAMVMMTMSFATYAEESAAGNKIDWNNVTVSISDDVITFKESVKDIFEKGWVLSEGSGEDMEINPLDYGYLAAERNDNQAFFYIANMSLEPADLTDCQVVGIDIDSYDFDYNTESVTVMDKIKCGETSIQELKDVLGEEDFSYPEEQEGSKDEVTVLVYTDSATKQLTFSIDPESGKVKGFSYSDSGMTTEMEDSINDEVHEDVASYEKPTEIGASFEDYRIGIEGNIYRLPVPVKTLLDDEWTFDSELDKDTALVSNGYKNKTMIKEDSVINVIVYNPYDTPEYMWNCWIYEIEIIPDEEETVINWEIPAGIKHGTTRQELEGIVGGLGMTEAEEMNDDPLTYTVENLDDWDWSDTEEPESEELEWLEEDTEVTLASEDSYDDYNIFATGYTKNYDVRVYTGDDGRFDKDSVYSVCVSNYPEGVYEKIWSEFLDE